MTVQIDPVTYLASCRARQICVRTSADRKTLKADFYCFLGSSGKNVGELRETLSAAVTRAVRVKSSLLDKNSRVHRSLSGSSYMSVKYKYLTPLLPDLSPAFGFLENKRD